MADELQDKGSSETCKMARWLADNAPETGLKLANLRNNWHGLLTHSWQPWHTEHFRMLLELLNLEVGFTKQHTISSGHTEDGSSGNHELHFNKSKKIRKYVIISGSNLPSQSVNGSS